MAVLDDLLAKKEDNTKTVVKTAKVGTTCVHLFSFDDVHVKEKLNLIDLQILHYQNSQGSSNTSSNSAAKRRRRGVGGTAGGCSTSSVQNNKSNALQSKRITKSTRAGLQFPVTKFHRLMKENHHAKRVTQSAAVYLSAVVEYLSAEILELSGNACRDNKRKRLVPRHILLAVKNDEELDRMCSKVTIRSGGVLPFVHPVIS
ncbi:unnamed protein product [Anisakis simplex]|uniref:Histone H2A n=1 Tax=Anisakis simplex TaxID=6269 RepID=A0A0M3JQY1_ANISI|nr:unnamed protein product [Anisakis simplex]